jgi:hypothetical protein
MIRGISLSLWLSLALVACDGSAEPGDTDADAEPTLTCEVLADPDFCWLTSVEEAYACVDPSLDGVFDEARSTCTYPDGVTVAFAEPVPEDLFGEENYSFAFDIIGSEGSECASFGETETGFSLTSTGGTFNSGVAGLFGLALECPSGDTYETNDGFSLFECDGAVFPGFMYSGGLGSVSLSLIGSPEGTFGLINCAPPE